eukprot:7835582-Lingulodinium_polyedra.AAC.1
MVRRVRARAVTRVSRIALQSLARPPPALGGLIVFGGVCAFRATSAWGVGKRAGKPCAPNLAVRQRLRK